MKQHILRLQKNLFEKMKAAANHLPSGAQTPAHIALELMEGANKVIIDELTKADSDNWHEVMDRSYIFLEMWQRNIKEHPVMQSDPGLQRKAEKIEELVLSFYQDASEKV